MNTHTNSPLDTRVDLSVLEANGCVWRCGGCERRLVLAVVRAVSAVADLADTALVVVRDEQSSLRALRPAGCATPPGAR
jgi:hypothetical protein